MSSSAYLVAWSLLLHTPYTPSPNHYSPFTTQVHTIITYFTIIPTLHPLLHQHIENPCVNFHSTTLIWRLFCSATQVSQYLKDKPLQIVLKQEMKGWHWHQLDHMQFIRTSLQTDNYASRWSLFFYRSYALPNVNQQHQSTLLVLIHYMISMYTEPLQKVCSVVIKDLIVKAKATVFNAKGTVCEWIKFIGHAVDHFLIHFMHRWVQWQSIFALKSGSYR